MVKLRKIIGIGAVLSAGLAGAGMASASVQLEIIAGNGQSEFLPTTASSSASYTSSSGSFGGFSWSAITVSSNAADPAQAANLTLGITDLTNATASSFPSYAIEILASGNGFSYDPVGTNYLQSSGSLDYSSGTSGDGVGQTSYQDNSNALFGETNSLTPDNSPYTVPNPAPSGSTPVSLGQNEVAISPTSGYSLTVSASFVIQATSSVSNYGGSFQSVVSNTPFVASTPLPGSGSLALVGGLALIGAMAIRRRVAR
jgi:hypothetical protein